MTRNEIRIFAGTGITVDPIRETTRCFRETIERLEDLTAICPTAPVNQAAIHSALRSPFTDFEDAVVNSAALTVGANCIVTRNEADFLSGSVDR